MPTEKGQNVYVRYACVGFLSMCMLILFIQKIIYKFKEGENQNTDHKKLRYGSTHEQMYKYL